MVCCAICDFVWAYVAPVFGVAMLFSLFSYFSLVFIQVFFCGEQNLKRKYNAEWAVVTGGSSGIGRSIVEKLARQGINVVIAALADDLLAKSVDEVRRKYPNVQILPCGVNLTREGYINDLEKVTKDLKVSIVFNNAGYINTGFFTEKPLGSQVANLHCNAVSAVEITYYFIERMQKQKLKGCVVFTSSPVRGQDSDAIAELAEKSQLPNLLESKTRFLVIVDFFFSVSPLLLSIFPPVLHVFSLFCQDIALV